MISQTSGAAGLVHWIRSEFGAEAARAIDKRDERLVPVLNWIESEYDAGRQTAFGDDELRVAIQNYAPELFAQLTGLPMLESL